MNFKKGVPACPVACKYCFITEHDERRELWNQNSFAGINKASTFINVTPWIQKDSEEQRRFAAFDWSLLKGDTVGFTAITDPFYPIIERYLWQWLENATPHAKLTTCVTKWRITPRVMQKLAEYPNFRLVVSINGNGSIEKVSTKFHLETLALAKQYGVKALPICHPYIAGVSDLSFLNELVDLGYEFFDVKGLRYCDNSMGDWMPEASKHYYLGSNDEVLPEDGWRTIVHNAGLQLLSPAKWYEKERKGLQPKCTMNEAVKLVEEMMSYANVVSSNSTNAVKMAAILRRL